MHRGLIVINAYHVGYVAVSISNATGLLNTSEWLGDSESTIFDTKFVPRGCK